MMYDVKKWMLPALIALPLYGCSDSSPPTWTDGSKATLDLNESDILVKWPEATDDKGVASYRVMVDDELGVETNADARNWTSKELPTGEDHNIEVIAIDAAGNESEPLAVVWEARDLTAPTWPVGSLVKVEAKAGDTEEAAESADADEAADQKPADAAENESEMKLVLTWPDATDDDGVEFYRVLMVPSTDDKKNVRPKVVGLVREGNSIETTGLASTRFQVYAVDSNDNSSKPIMGALNNPTRINPLRQVKAPDLRSDSKSKETPRVEANGAE